MIMAFQGFFSSFTAPAESIISAGQTIQEMRTEMERVEDVMKYPVDVYKTTRRSMKTPSTTSFPVA